MSDALEVKLLPRHWTGTRTADAAHVTVATFNCLAPSLATGFSHASDESLAWEKRLPLLVAEIKRCDASIICLQEVERDCEFAITVMCHLVDHYESIYISKGDGHADGLLVFYHYRHLLVNMHEVRYTNDDSSEQTQRGIILEFVDFTLATTHLKAKHGFEAVRRSQIAQLLYVVDKCHAKHPNPALVPAIIAGDLNEHWDGPALELLRNAGFCCAYKDMTGQGTPWTTWKCRPSAGERRCTEDYVLIRGIMTVEAVFEVPADEDIPKERLPCSQHGSDHVALAACLRLRDTP